MKTTYPAILVKNPYFTRPNISETDNAETVISKADAARLYFWNKSGASTYSPEQRNCQWTYMLWHGSTTNTMYTFFIASDDQDYYVYHKNSDGWRKIMSEYVQSGTLSILLSRVTHSETVLQKCGKLVILSDKFTPASDINAYTKFLQAPTGYRPKTIVNFTCVGPDGTSPHRLYIETDGGIGCRENLTSGTEYAMYVSYFIP